MAKNDRNKEKKKMKKKNTMLPITDHEKIWTGRNTIDLQMKLQFQFIIIVIMIINHIVIMGTIVHQQQFRHIPIIMIIKSIHQGVIFFKPGAGAGVVGDFGEYFFFDGFKTEEFN